MKFLKTVKGKIIAASIVGILLLGTTYAFANTNIGEQLRAWYEALVNEKSEEILAQLDEEMDNKITEAVEKYNEIADEATVEIENTRDQVTANALSSIDQAKTNHLENLGIAKEDILGQVEEDFYAIFLDGYFEISRVAEEGLAQAEAGLTAHTAAVGENALNKVVTE